MSKAFLILLLLSLSFCPVLASSNNDGLDKIAVDVNAGKINQELASSLTQRINNNPKEVRSYFLLAELYQNAGFQDLAGQLLDRCEELAPGAFLESFRQSVYFGDTSFADKYLIYAQQKYPLEASVLMMNARGLKDHRRYKESLSVIAPVMYYGSSVPGLCNLLADLNLQQGNYEKAVIYANRELAARPEDMEAQDIRIVALNKLEKDLDSERATILKLYKNRKTRIDIGILLANTLVKKQFFREALEPCLFGLWCFSDQDMNKRNMETLKKILGFIPAPETEILLHKFITDNKVEPMLEAMIDLKMGEAYKARGNTNIAISYFERSLRLSPFFSEKICFEMAPLLELTHNYSEAADFYRRAFIASPGNREIRREYSAFQWGYKRILERQANPDLASKLKNWLRETQKNNV